MNKMLKFRNRNLNIRNQKIPSKSNKFVLLICVLMILPFFTFNVNASDVILEDFDDYAEGVQSGVNPNDLCSWSADNGITSTSRYKSSPLSLKIPMTFAGHNYQYINLTSNTDLSGFEFWFYAEEENVNAYTIVSLKDSNDTDIVVFKISHMHTADFEIYDYDTYTSLYSDNVKDNWYCIGFQSNHSVGNPINYVYYYVKNLSGGILASVEKRWCSLNEYDNEVLSQIKLDCYDSVASSIPVYFDDFTILDYTPPEYEGDFAFDSNDNIGSLDTTCMVYSSKKDIEFKYHVPVTINATGFDLLVDSNMYIYDDDLSNYDLFINGEPMGNPTEWKEYSNNYVLRWEFSTPKVIENSEILYELWHDVYIVGNYWIVGAGCNYADMDGDWMALMKHSNTYPNGAFDGTILIQDIAYKIYFDIFSFIEDVINVTYDSITTIDGSYYVGDSVPLTYMLQTSNMIYDNYVKIWNDDTSTEITIDSKQGFPYLCLYQLETIGFVPFTSANYTAYLYINDVEITNVSFFVDDHINPDMHVFTYPNPSKVGKGIRVQYNYDHPTGKSGAVFLCNSPNLNSYISVYQLSDGDSGFWTYTHDTAGTYYYIMAVDITGNGTYGIVDDGIHPHEVKSEHGNNFFKLKWYKLRLNVEGSVAQIVNGECNMLSGNCFIYDNNKLIKTITDSPFSYSYEVHTAGLHTVEMRLITNVTTVIFTQDYTVTTFTGEDEIEQIEDTSYILHDWVYDLYGDIGVFMAGVCVVLGFMFIPFALVLYVNVSYNKNIELGDLHWSVYIIFAIVGVIVDVQLHLAELWIILLICVVSIAIAVVTHKGNR